ncbi:uncharacterized protein K452DRAFT_351588 [Aplosporella prunicola CBS 121167]|uniref:Major facilitator superfamily (MFS) profile domain-containing protein n=1 Tax=Aplosporella prunicola CBS 121167 TaxID=1176127 RepID=A0A6A6BBT0_9PEZI|nr:uncharacterized protein K452DRAFT_351588 [Aplosporella prunicola CBS 121167]KAF2140823.1 hypothetical protein K452DRAFT_351588 [Aplosporella prunicola CBS 121167]
METPRKTPPKVTIPRKKACAPCSQSKVRCDQTRPYCTRCEKRGITDECAYEESATQDTGRSSSRGTPQVLNFAVLDLVCTIDPEEVRNRWLKLYLPMTDQTPKSYPPNVTAFLSRILKAYSLSPVRNGTLPPFVHFYQQAPPSISTPLANCLTLARVCDQPLPGSQPAVHDTLKREMERLYSEYTSYGEMELLAAFQAYLIYAMLIYFHFDETRESGLQQAMLNLQDMACEVSRRGLVSTAELNHSRPQWESWIVAEAKRRSIYTMYLFDSLLCARDGLPTFLGTELRGVPAPGSKELWQATDRGAWSLAYNGYLHKWGSDGQLRIDELWPVPLEFSEADIENRRSRVDHWVSSLDEFGTMLFAVTSMTSKHLWYYLVQGHIVHGIVVEAPANASPKPASASNEQPFSIFSKPEKAFIIIIVSTAATFSGFASNIYFPSLPTIASDLGVSVELVNLTVTSYMIFQGLAPSLWGAVADSSGRRITYICTFLVFFAACVALANTRNYATLVAVRCLQSTGSAATIAIGSGVIGDITTRAERGGFMGIFQAGLLVPVAIGPVIGGALSSSLGWRAIFWFLAIYAGAFLLFLVVFLPETLRALVGNGSVPCGDIIRKYPLALYQHRYQRRSSSMPPQQFSDLPPKKPINILASLQVLVDKRVVPIIAFLSFYYMAWQVSITVLSSLMKTTYGLDDTKIGLTFIANGVGAMVGTISTGKILDYDYRAIQRKCAAAAATTGREVAIPLDTARLRTVWVWSAMQVASLLVFGWSLDRRVHLAVPIIATFFTGWAAMSLQSMVSTYIVDVFPDRSASASAAMNLARCLMGAGGTAAAMPVIKGIGAGWGFTLLVGVMVAALGLVVVQVRFGGRWREQEREGE